MTSFPCMNCRMEYKESIDEYLNGKRIIEVHQCPNCGHEDHIDVGETTEGE